MKEWARKPLVVLISFVSGVIGTLKLIADWIGRSTVPEDAGALAVKMDDLIAWLADQPPLLFYGIPIGLAAVALALAFLPEVFSFLGIHRSGQLTQAAKRVILTDPEPVYGFDGAGGHNRVVQTVPAPPHSIADLRYQVELEDNPFSGPKSSEKAKISIRELGSNDPPVLIGVGETKVKLNRHSKFEIAAEYPKGATILVQLWLLGWTED